ncbi:MAG TPA: CHRD domain-containing protein [Caulobacteraceae bacterium]|jgi:hypothetical protein
MNIRAIAAASSAAAMIASAAQAGILHYEAILKGASESPPTSAAGRGEMIGVLDTDRRLLDYTVTFSGLTGPAVATGFHGKDSGVKAAVSTPADGKAGPVHAEVHLTDAQIADLNAGRWTFDIDTHANPSGEIGGTVMRSSGSN